MKIEVICLFPGMVQGALDESIIQRARSEKIVEMNFVNLREYTHDRHRTVDDRPFGGGPGMVLKPEPIFEAIEDLKTPASRVLLMSPSGTSYRQSMAQELSQESHLILICGHYEGIDARVESIVDDVISIGDFVLTNGGIAATVVIDSIVRLLPGVLGDSESPVEESFSTGLLEYPHYTRPANFRGMEVPEVLLSGNHAEIAKWRKLKAMERTESFRPDLINRKKES